MTERPAAQVLLPLTAKRRRRRRRAVLAAVVVVVVLAGLLVWRPGDRSAGPGLAAQAVVTASSSDLGSTPRAVVDTGSATSPGASWRSRGEPVGAWIELGWAQSHLLHRVVLVRDGSDEATATDGYLTFDDGSYLQVRLAAGARETVVALTPRRTTRLRFTASAVAPGARDVVLAEILVSDQSGEEDVASDDSAGGNVALSAKATQSGGTAGDDGAAAPDALRDGSASSGAAGTGADWTSGRAQGEWVELSWDRPRELASLQVVGSEASAARLASATAVFSDGSTLPVGAVLAEPDRPTTVSFMPRSVTSVRLVLDRVTGSGVLALAELRLYRAGATPVRTRSSAPDPAPLTAAEPCGSTSGDRPSSGLTLSCPQAGSTVGDEVELRVSAAAPATSVTATVWPAVAGAAAGEAVRAEVDASGTAALGLDLAGVAPGPFTVRLQAEGPGRDTTAYVQLHRRGDPPTADVASQAQSRGRTLVEAEEFDRPVSLSRDGRGADYAAAKPTAEGAEDFGEAIFADPALGLDNVRTVDDRYLRIDVSPKPDSLADPQGWGRTHVGGLLAGARSGGSGSSAQYGYFEARMFAPAAPGTWPAFWMLPSDNLEASTPTVAEIDVAELYGHDPRGVCSSTHGYEGGEDSGVARCGRRFDTERDALGWHTYGASVTPTAITYYIDGREVASAPQVEGGGAPLFFLVDLALGGGWPVELDATGGRASLYVDYVRVYV